MNFLQPWMLLGVLAAFVPLVLHLMNRRKATRVAFPMLAALQRSQKRRAPALKVRRWLLLLARIGILLLIPLAMAQPYTVCQGGAQTAGDRHPTAVVLIVDGSASMSRDGGARRTQAVDEAKRQLRQLRAWDQVRVLVDDGDAVWLTDRWGSDAAAAIRALESYTWRDGEGSLPRALIEARSALFDAPVPGRRTIVLTDNDANAWHSEHLRPEALHGMGEVVVQSLRGSEDLETSVFIDDLSWEEVVGSATDVVEVIASLRRVGDDKTSTFRVHLEVDGAPVGVEQASLDGEASTTVRFSHVFAGEGTHRVRVFLEGAPGAAALQQRAMPVYLSRAVNALLVNGESSAVESNDELYYLTRALAVDVGERQAIHSRVVTPDRFKPASLDGMDVVLLANVETLERETVAALRAFVEAGGGLWITPGKMVEPARYNALFGDLLPRALRDVTKLTDAQDPDANIRATRFALVDHTSALFRIFSMPGGSSLQSARVFSYVLLEPDMTAHAKVLASYADGGPAVVEMPFGAGRVVLWTTTLDQDWTDLPIRTAFVPLVHRTMRYLAQRGSSATLSEDIGRTVQLDMSGLSAESVQFEAPDGAHHVLEPIDDRVRFQPWANGVYDAQVQRQGAWVPAPELSFAANAPRVEAAQPRVAPAIVDAWVEAAGSGFAAADGREMEANRRRVWPSLLLVGLLLLYAESLLTVRRRVWATLIGRRAHDTPVGR